MPKILLSLCIPTNGVDSVFQVLDSIYSQGEDDSLFEVVVADNGNNEEFKKKMLEHSKLYKNLVYKQNNANGFLNGNEAYKVASGEFIKFINHRTTLKEGSLGKFISFVKDNIANKPAVYFLNGELKLKDTNVYPNFDLFVRGLKNYSSWSTGIAFWKEDFEKISDFSSFNPLFPHTGVLFSERHKNTYIIDNRVLLYEIPASQKNKGKYDIFKAFAVEYPTIIKGLFESGDITAKTLDIINKANQKFLGQIYFDFIIRKHECSYDLSSFEESVKVYYSAKTIKRLARRYGFKRVLAKLCFWKKTI